MRTTWADMVIRYRSPGPMMNIKVSLATTSALQLSISPMGWGTRFHVPVSPLKLYCIEPTTVGVSTARQ